MSFKVADYGVLGRYLEKCRKGTVDYWRPPSGREAADLFQYLHEKRVKYAVVGELGAVHYFPRFDNPPTKWITVFVQADPERYRRLPPPSGWMLDGKFTDTIDWITPTLGRVRFLCANQLLPDGTQVPATMNVVLDDDLGALVATL